MDQKDKPRYTMDYTTWFEANHSKPITERDKLIAYPPYGVPKDRHYPNYVMYFGAEAWKNRLQD